MKLIVGLGNPGRAYKDTPHNVGFEMLNIVRNKLGQLEFEVGEWETSNPFSGEICKVRKSGEIEYVLLKPQTFMNLSGISISKICQKMKFSKISIIHDDLDLKFGTFKIQVGKKPKDHNGVNNIATKVDIGEAVMVRIGVDNRNGLPIPGEKYVLMKMKAEELEILGRTFEKASNQLINSL
ncbi:aminoacyl-tRNA hydrolase [Candidatus Dojkabacteria bacterium]|jgi:PTH1 family peptidyl-tRNA hydrolase|nr:aminoacyl-tRNA hydrolase [Candidatus Dojkabacteria bacterium]